MIQNINQFNAKQVTNKPVITSLVGSNDIQNKEVMLALSKIQLGDLISGKIILEQDQTILKLENGLKLIAQLPYQILSDCLLDFLVVGKSRQHLELELVQTNPGYQNEQGMEEAIIKEMQLPNNQEMKQIIGQWMDKQFPLIKNQLLQVYHFAKNYDLPSEALVNLSGAESVLNEQEMQLMSKFKTEGIEFINHLVGELVSKMEYSEVVAFNISLSQHSSADFLKQILFQGESLLQTNLSMSESKEVESISMKDVVVKQSFEDLMWQINDIEKVPLIESKNDLLKSIFQLFPKDYLQEITKQLVHKYLTVSPSDFLEDVDGMMKLDEVTSRLENIVEEVEKHVKQEATSTEFRNLEQMTQVLDKYQTQGQYYCFPLQIKEYETSGELYYFKPKKNKKGNKDSQGMYIVLALDMPSLKHIEIHLIEQKETLGVKIKVANDIILKQMKENEDKLRKLIDDTLIPIGEISIECLQMPTKKKVSKQENQLNRLDFRI